MIEMERIVDAKKLRVVSSMINGGRASSPVKSSRSIFRFIAVAACGLRRRRTLHPAKRARMRSRTSWGLTNSAAAAELAACSAGCAGVVISPPRSMVGS